jgi:hypothetical protein
VIVAVFRRRLKAGKSFEDFKQAWEAKQGFGAPTRVFNAVNLADDREVLSIGFVAVEPEALPAGIARVDAQEQRRHSRIDDVIESTELRAIYRLATEHDLQAIHARSRSARRRACCVRSQPPTRGWPSRRLGGRESGTCCRNPRFWTRHPGLGPRLGSAK